MTGAVKNDNCLIRYRWPSQPIVIRRRPTLFFYISALGWSLTPLIGNMSHDTVDSETSMTDPRRLFWFPPVWLFSTNEQEKKTRSDGADHWNKSSALRGRVGGRIIDWIWLVNDDEDDDDVGTWHLYWASAASAERRGRGATDKRGAVFATQCHRGAGNLFYFVGGRRRAAWRRPVWRHGRPTSSTTSSSSLTTPTPQERDGKKQQQPWNLSGSGASPLAFSHAVCVSFGRRRRPKDISFRFVSLLFISSLPLQSNNISNTPPPLPLSRFGGSNSESLEELFNSALFHFFCVSIFKVFHREFSIFCPIKEEMGVFWWIVSFLIGEISFSTGWTSFIEVLRQCGGRFFFQFWFQWNLPMNSSGWTQRKAKLMVI